MKIYLISDLHVEFHGDFPMPKSPVDVIALAGDIDVGIGMLDVAQQYSQRCKAPVVVVAGNHEYYGADMLTLLPALRQRAAELTDVHFLEKDSVVINGVRFLGCTLWSNFAFNGALRTADAKAAAQLYIADFRLIRYGKRPFTPDDACTEFEASYRWLDDELAKPFSGNTVVVTHFLPHAAGVHPMHRRSAGGDHLTPYFTVDCDRLMRKHNIASWLYGHTHNSVDVTQESGTRIVSNQRGYPNEAWTYTCHDPQKVIEISNSAKKRARLDATWRLNELLEQNGGTRTARDVASLMKVPERKIHRMIKDRDLLAYRDCGFWCLPTAQFDPDTGRPASGLRQLLLGFPDGTAARNKILFCLTSFESTNKTPLQLIAEDYDANVLAQAAAAYATRRE